MLSVTNQFAAILSYILAVGTGGLVMSDDDLTGLLDWLRRFQGVEIEEGRLREPAAMSARYCELTERLAGELPFEAEPANFLRARKVLSRREGGHGR